MTTILPSERTPFDVIGRDVGQAMQSFLPQAIQRRQGLSAIDQLEQSIQQGIVDPQTGMRRDLSPQELSAKYARIGAINPGLERALGPLLTASINNSKVRGAFPNQPGGNVPGGQQPGQGPMVPGMQPQGQTQTPQTSQAPYEGAPSGQPKDFATPGPFNIMAPQDITAESERYAAAVQDPNAAAMRQAQLQNQNEIATQQRQALEDMALKSDISASELPRFMQVGSKFDPRNPSEWMQNTKREYAKIKSNDKKIEREFIPGIGSGLLGRNRDAALKRLVPSSQDQKKLGLEDDLRNYYADQYMSPTEIEEQFRPLTPGKEKAIKGLPQGSFTPKEKIVAHGFGVQPIKKKSPAMSYEEALEKQPEKLKQMQDTLAEFFMNNLGDDTSILVLRDKLVNDKGYDWRQIGPAVRQAMSKGLKLDPRQSTEMADVESNPPMQSLPDVFRDLDRIVPYLQGSK